ncbi:PUTATIVE TWO-COMPONENT SENSOR [hydrothermal vent metagenome]|uniref:PUTATIVE TWO-COMPONENT SENSOR n=1 Tax=hydrothermal vent metagenome TaxID=652676 RepID=A0A1W1BUS6_9ZZZZ
MHNKEIIDAICANHSYEYLVVNRCYEVIDTSENISRYCDAFLETQNVCNLFCAVPEFIGMEEALTLLFEGKEKTLSLPLIFKSPDQYINLYVYLGARSETLIVLFENITEKTYAQQQARQSYNENLLLLDEIADKNRRLEAYSQEMKTLVDEEVRKNVEKQHMLELQNRHAQMGEMIAIITHQWKQPLNVIQTICANLKLKYEIEKLSFEFVMEKVDEILNQSKFMDTTVADFQNFFSPSKSKSKFYLGETIQSLIGLVKEDYIVSNITLEVEVNDEVWIEGYANEYSQVILSILQNAKEAFLENPSEDMRIYITISQYESHSYVCISDNAGGIPLAILPKIFEQYETSKEQGSGLGLHIAKSIIEKNMNGQIWATNTQEGASFHIVV